MEHSPIRKLIPYAREVEQKGIRVLYGNIGQPDLSTPQAYKDAAVEYYEDEKKSRIIAYGPSEGLPILRDSYVRFLRRQGIEITQEDVFITVAASEALLFVLLTVCDPGDEIIIPEPFYTNYRTFCAMAGVKIHPLTLGWETGYAFPGIKAIEQLVTPRTKAILLCSPNNPSGTTYGKQELLEISNLCREHDIHLIVDEVYREFVYEEQPLSILQLPNIDQHVIVIDSLSKRFSLCGARVGMVVCKNKLILNNLLKMAQARLCPVTVEQVAAISLLETGDEAIKAMREIYRKRLDLLCSSLEKIPGVACHRPQGAFYVMVRLPVQDASEFARYMVSNVVVNGETLLVAPATGFYITEGLGKNEIRIAAVMDETSILSAVKIIATALAQGGAS
jgi:aspartate aminotransferase